MQPLSLTRDALHAAYGKGTPARDVIRACLMRIEAIDDAGIFLYRPEQSELLAAAEALPAFDPERYPLWGLPFAVKDNIDVAGWPTSAACPDFARITPDTAPVVQLLRDAGAVLVGKTNLDQFATGLVGVRTPYPVPRNPFDPARVPGGSSSGSAVAVAQDLVSFSLGTDTAGSGRVPAAFNNLVGLKPSLGAISTRGVVPACRTLDCVSIFAQTVSDARAVFDVAAVYDAAEPYARRVMQTDQPIRSVGVPAGDDLRFFGDEAAAEAWRGSLAALARTGVTVREIPFGHFLDTAAMLYAGPWVAERRAAVGSFMDRHPEAMHPVTRAILSDADRHSAVDVFNAVYRLAAQRRRCEQTFADVDALAVPTAPIFPTLADLAADPIGPNSRLGTYTNFVNLLDLAAIALPGPFRADGLPAGLTLIAPAGADHRLADLGQIFFPGRGGLPHAVPAAA
jgi:allophanate hydrolase